MWLSQAWVLAQLLLVCGQLPPYSKGKWMVWHHRKNKPLGTVVLLSEDGLERKRFILILKFKKKKKGPEISKIKAPNGENSISKSTFGNH